VTRTLHPYAHRILSAIKDTSTLTSADRIAIACSGGPDSLAALFAICAISREGHLPVPVCVLHYHHGMRGAEADADADYVVMMATRCGIPAEVGYGQGMGWNEQQARDHRYAWLVAAARKRGANVIVTAHTSTDQAMTVLLRMLRGTHTDGLAGIPPRRELSGGIDVARPLLGETRDAGIDFLNDIGVASRHDPTNDNTDFPRNRLRNTFGELTSEFNGNLTDALCRIADAAREDSAFIGVHVQELLNNAATSVIGIWKIAPLAAAHPALRSRAILDILAREIAPDCHEAALVELNVRTLGRVLINGGKVVLPGGFHVEARGPWLVFSDSCKHPGVVLRADQPILLPNGLQIQMHAVTDDAGVVADPSGMSCFVALPGGSESVVLRLTRSGDQIGLKRTVTDVCRSAGIPPEERPAVWVAVCPTTGDILWVPGVPFGQRTLQHGVPPTHLLVAHEPSKGC
jgi:tRNA(Ile)-lysidine synthase